MRSLAHNGMGRRRQRGAGMIEMMVGILIGMIVLVVVYNVLSLAEGHKRAAVGASDAQVTGLLTQLVASRDAGNGGAGIMMSGGSVSAPADLINCTKAEGGAPLTGVPLTSLAAAARPIPVIITDGGGAGVADSFISYSTGASRVVWPVDFIAPFPVAAGAAIIVQSPNGFSAPVPTAAAPYWAVAMVNDGTGRCKMLRVRGAVPDPTLPLTGRVTLTQDPATATGISYASGDPPRLLNLGVQGLATRVRYDVDPVVANAVLRTTDLLVVPPNPLVPVPIAQNIVLLKAQYGVDTDDDDIVDCWTPANALVCGDFTDTAVRAFTLAQLNRILAVRIGVVVRSDEPDLRLLTDPANTDLQDQARGILQATRPQVVLFNCSTNNAACQSRVIVPLGAGTGSPNCAPDVICNYWRYRTYETVIPLRNVIYAASMPP